MIKIKHDGDIIFKCWFQRRCRFFKFFPSPRLAARPLLEILSFSTPSGPLFEVLFFTTCYGSSMTQNFENVFYYFSSVEWHQLSTASASKRLHTLVTRSLQLGCERPSEKTMAIFFALVFFEHESVFGDAEQGRRAFLDLKQDVKSLFNRLHGLYHCPTVECLPENPTQVDFFVMESIFQGQSWPAEPPIDVLQLRQKAASVPLRSTNSVLRPHVDMALQGASSMASSHLAAPSSASNIFIFEPASSAASSSSHAPRACGEASCV